MAGHRALEAVAVSVVALINRKLEHSSEVSPRPTALLVGPGAPQLSHQGSGAMILVHPYHVALDPTPAPGPAAGLGPRTGGQRRQAPGTALTLRLLVSASAKDPETELATLGLAVVVLQETPLLTPDLLEPVGNWSEEEQVRLVPAVTGPDELTNVFAALGLPARPAVAYEAGGIVIRS